MKLLIAFCAVNLVCLLGCITFYCLSIKVLHHNLKAYKDMAELFDKFAKLLNKGV